MFRQVWSLGNLGHEHHFKKKKKILIMCFMHKWWQITISYHERITSERREWQQAAVRLLNSTVESLMCRLVEFYISLNSDKAGRRSVNGICCDISIFFFLSIWVSFNLTPLFTHNCVCALEPMVFCKHPQDNDTVGENVDWSNQDKEWHGHR